MRDAKKNNLFPIKLNPFYRIDMQFVFHSLEKVNTSVIENGKKKIRVELNVMVFYWHWITEKTTVKNIKHQQIYCLESNKYLN